MIPTRASGHATATRRLVDEDPLALLDRPQRLAVECWLDGGRFGLLLTGDAWLADELFRALLPSADQAFGHADSVDAERVGTAKGPRVLARAWDLVDLHPALLRTCTAILVLGSAAQPDQRGHAAPPRRPGHVVDPVAAVLGMLSTHGIADHGLDVSTARLMIALSGRCQDALSVCRQLVAAPRSVERSRPVDTDASPGTQPADEDELDRPDDVDMDLGPLTANEVAAGDGNDDDGLTESAPTVDQDAVSRDPDADQFDESSARDDREAGEDGNLREDAEDQSDLAADDELDTPASGDDPQADILTPRAPADDERPVATDGTPPSDLADADGAPNTPSCDLGAARDTRGPAGAVADEPDPSLHTAMQVALALHRKRSLAPAHHPGRRGIASVSSMLGKPMREVALERAQGRLAVIATMRRAAIRRASTEASLREDRPIRSEDLRGLLRRRRGGVHTVVIIDGSSSMGVAGTGRTRSAADVALARIASERGSASVVLAAGTTATLLLSCTTSASRIRSLISGIVPDGGTPLADAALLAAGLCSDRPRVSSRVLILSDARATVASDGRTDTGWVRTDLTASLLHLGTVAGRVVLAVTGSPRFPPLDRDLAPFTSAGVRIARGEVVG